jgi:hypothetical protein
VRQFFFIYKVDVNLWSNRNSVNRRPSSAAKREQISGSIWPRRLDFLGKRLMFVGLTMDVASCHHSGACSWKGLLYLRKICGHLLFVYLQVHVWSSFNCCLRQICCLCKAWCFVHWNYRRFGFRNVKNMLYFYICIYVLFYSEIQGEQRVFP